MRAPSATSSTMTRVEYRFRHQRMLRAAPISPVRAVTNTKMPAPPKAYTNLQQGQQIRCPMARRRHDVQRGLQAARLRHEATCWRCSNLQGSLWARPANSQKESVSVPGVAWPAIVRGWGWRGSQLSLCPPLDVKQHIQSICCNTEARKPHCAWLYLRAQAENIIAHPACRGLPEQAPHCKFEGKACSTRGRELSVSSLTLQSDATPQQHRCASVATEQLSNPT